MGKNIILGLAVGLALVLVATPAQADDDLRSTIRDEIAKWSEAKDDNTFKVYWKNGLRLDTGNKNVKMKIGGRIQLDHYFVDDDDWVAAGVPDDGFESGVEARRIRLYNAGVLHDHVEWKLQMDFADPEDPEFADVYIGLVNMDDCFGCLMPNIRVGHFKAPFGLEELTSSKYITFIERSSATNTFAIGRRYGVMLHDVFRGGQLGYGVGYFTEDTSFDDDGEVEFDDGYGIAARVWWAPWYDCACACRRLHVGAGAYLLEDITSTGVSDDGLIRTGSDPDLISAGGPADSVFTWNIELALVYGPWSIQGEYFNFTADNPTGGDPTLTGWYAQASYWITGECRNWKNGVFSRVSPCCNFLDNDCCCYGGLELAARYGVVDLNDGAIVQGGEMTNWTFGLNWHLNPNARIQINYVVVNVEGGNFNIPDESASALAIRWQVDW